MEKMNYNSILSYGSDKYKETVNKEILLHIITVFSLIVSLRVD